MILIEKFQSKVFEVRYLVFEVRYLVFEVRYHLLVFHSFFCFFDEISRLLIDLVFEVRYFVFEIR